MVHTDPRTYSLMMKFATWTVWTCGHWKYDQDFSVKDEGGGTEPSARVMFHLTTLSASFFFFLLFNHSFC